MTAPPPDSTPRAARDVAPGERWAFPDHRSLAEVPRDEAADQEAEAA